MLQQKMFLTINTTELITNSVQFQTHNKSKYSQRNPQEAISRTSYQNITRSTHRVNNNFLYRNINITSGTLTSSISNFEFKYLPLDTEDTNIQQLVELTSLSLVRVEAAFTT